MKLLLVIAGGGIGAAMRYGIIILFPTMTNGFSYAILLVNSVGSLLAGAIIGYFVDSNLANETWQLFLLVGVLSSFTTFAAFSTETMQYFLKEEYFFAVVNIISNVVICLIAVYAGFTIGKLLYQFVS